MIKLVLLPGGGFDVALDDSNEPTGAVATVIYALLLTDARAPVEREADAFAAGGWWARPEAGSGLWHTRRQALSAAARTESVRIVQQALGRDAAFSGVTVEDVSDPSGPGAGGGNVSTLQLRVGGKHNGRQFLIDLSL